MKKYLRITILAIILILASTLNVYAVENNITLRTSATEVKVGDTLEIVIAMKCEEDFQGLTGFLEWDKTKLELEGVANGKDFKDLNAENSEGEYVVSILTNTASSITEGNLQTLKFKILDEVKEGESLNVTLSDINFKVGEDKATVENQTATVKVVANSEGINGDDDPDNTDEPGNTEKPSDNPATENNDKLQENPDDTQANKDINDTGLRDHTFAIITGIVLVAIISYIKYRQYKNM